MITLTKEKIRIFREYIDLTQMEFIRELNKFHKAEIIRSQGKAAYMNLSHIESGNVDLTPRLAKPILEFMQAKYPDAYKYIILQETPPQITFGRLSDKPQIKAAEVRIFLNLKDSQITNYEKEGILKRIDPEKRDRIFTKESVLELAEHIAKTKMQKIEEVNKIEVAQTA